MCPQRDALSGLWQEPCCVAGSAGSVSLWAQSMGESPELKLKRALAPVISPVLRRSDGNTTNPGRCVISLCVLLSAVPCNLHVEQPEHAQQWLPSCDLEQDPLQPFTAPS